MPASHDTEMPPLADRTQYQPNFVTASSAAPATPTGPIAFAARSTVTPASSNVTDEPATVDATPFKYTHSEPSTPRALYPNGLDWTVWMSSDLPTAESLNC